ncbi:hypothetical protein EV175_004817 [Coemansia sp. RSA 1933]|nr:hypothetical protein EV175_004817 [Coemansia sp. RSA 1933]
MNPYLTIIFACLCNAQFAFRLEDTDATSLYMDLQAMWADWAAAGNQVLESASAEGLTDAWSLLASIYGATSIPALYNDAMARNAASALAGAQSTTVWDPDAGDHAQYSFAVRSISTNNEFGSADETPTAPAATAFVTSAITVSGHDLKH